LRFGIISRTRIRKRNGQLTTINRVGKKYKIKSKFDIHVLNISAQNNLKLFSSYLGFNHTKKKTNLTNILKNITHEHTNLDLVPKVSSSINDVIKSLGLSKSQIGITWNFEQGVYNPSRKHLNKILEKLRLIVKSKSYEGRKVTLSNDIHSMMSSVLKQNVSNKGLAAILGLSEYRTFELFLRKSRKVKIPILILDRVCSVLYDSGFRELAQRISDEVNLEELKTELINAESKLTDLEKFIKSDIYWDEIVEIKELSNPWDYIYDLTVRDSHNFIVNGIFAHNTAAAVRDEFGEGRWTLEAGALVLADGGIACVDEMDKMTSQDAAANPKYGRFDEYRPISDQIDMPPALLSRFDVIFPVKDKPDKDMDLSMAEHILRSHLGGEIKEHRSESDDPKFTKDDEDSALQLVKPILSTEFLRKYIAYSRRNIFPVMTKDAIQDLADFYVRLRSQESTGETGAIAITPRQLEALVRLAEASARMRLSEQITNEDTERAIRIAQYYLKRVASESGILDIDMIATGVSHSQRGRIIKLTDIIKELCAEDKSGAANEDEVITEAESIGFEREQILKDIEKLRREGRIFKPSEKKIRLV
jgi:replicative DNA helicase Mcm